MAERTRHPPGRKPRAADAAAAAAAAAESATSATPPVEPADHLAPAAASSQASSLASSLVSVSGASLGSLLGSLAGGTASELFSSEGDSVDAELYREMFSPQQLAGEPVAIDRFAVVGLLGSGASAAVYSTVDKWLGRRVALKVLARPREDRVVEANDRVMREARALAQLAHRNVVAIYNLGTWKGHPFIAMELIEGMTLARWQAAQPRTTTEILEAYLQAGQGLAAAHAQGLVHRDFKPANVLVANDGRVVLSDFGLVGEAPLPSPAPAAASSVGTSTTDRPLAVGSAAVAAVAAPRPGRPIGTPAYAAPEQRAGTSAYPSADVFSFAVSLIEALIGHHPLSATGAPGASSSPGLAAPAPWRVDLRQRAPGPLYRALCAAMELDPARRTSSLAPLLAALGALTAARRRRRRRALGLAAAALVLGSALALGLGAWLWRAAPPLRRDFTETPQETPAALAENLSALLATPRSQRDERWRAAARSSLFLPVPAQIPCRWSGPPRTQAIVGGRVVSLDHGGALGSCDPATGEVSLLRRDVRCIVPDDRRAFGAVLRDGGLALLALDDAGAWRTETFTPAAARLAGLDPERVSEAGGYCVLNFAALGSRAWHLSIHAVPGATSLRSGELGVDRTADFQLWRRRAGQPDHLLDTGVTHLRADDALATLVVRSDGVAVIDVATGRQVRARQQPTRRAVSGNLALSRDGSTAVATSLEGELLWWRRGDLRWRRMAWAQPSITELAISPRGSRVAVFDHGGAMQVIELGTNRRYPLAGAQLRRAEFLDEDRVIAIDESARVWRWSLAEQRQLVLAAHPGTNSLWGLAVSPDGAAVASSGASRQDGAVRISWVDRSSTREQVELRPVGSVGLAGLLDLAGAIGIHALRFDDAPGAGRDRLLAGTTNSLLHVWRWPSLEKLEARALPAARWVWTVAVARPDADADADADAPAVELIGMGVHTSPPFAIELLLARAAAEPRALFTTEIRGNTGISDLAVSADGRRAVASVSSGQLVFVDVVNQTTTAVVSPHEIEARHVRFTDDDRVVSIGDEGTVKIWTATGAPLGELLIGHGKLYTLEVHGSSALVGASDGHLSLWDLTAATQLRSFLGHGVGISAAQLDAEGAWLASGDESGRLCLRPVDRQECHTPLPGHRPTRAIRNLRFVAGGLLVSGADDGTVRLWQPPYAMTDEQLSCELSRRAFSPASAASARAARPCAPSPPRRQAR